MLRRRVHDAIEAWLLRLWYGGAGPGDRVVAFLLAPFGLAASALVAGLARRRRRRLRRQPAGVRPAVVVVGNLVAGGAGKTPTVVALAQALVASGHRVGLLARGYLAPDATGSRTARLIETPTPDRPLPAADVVGDEALVLFHATGLPVGVGAERAAALALLSEHDPELTVVLSDDGLQHVDLARAVELVVVDERGFGNGHCLPAGPLREPVDRLASVDAVLLHRCDRLPAGAPQPPASFRLETRLASFRSLDGNQRWLPEAFARAVADSGEAVAAIAAIARPERFFDDLRALGLSIHPCPLPDHAAIEAAWLDGLAEGWLVMTAKDAVKLDPAAIAGTTSAGREPASPMAKGTRPLRRIVVAEQLGQLDDALLNWLLPRLPPPGPGPARQSPVGR